MPFLSSPWQMRAQAWLSLFAVRDTGREDRPSGLYGATFVDFEEGIVLTYHKLLVARLVRKHLADLPLRSGDHGPAVAAGSTPAVRWPSGRASAEAGDRGRCGQPGVTPVTLVVRS